MNISTGPSDIVIINRIAINNIEQRFPREISIEVQILSWISLVLINTSNGYLIHVIKNRMRSLLDLLILMDSILCILNCVSIIRLGIVGTSFAENIPMCFIFSLFGYFINVSHRLITIAISVYRYVFVVHHIKMGDRIQRQLFTHTLFSAIVLTSVALTGYAIYYKDSYMHYQRNVNYCS